MFRGEVHNIAKKLTQNLHTKYPKRNKKYREEVSRWFQTHNIYGQAKVLEEDTQQGFAIQDRLKLQAIDEAIGNAMLTPEKKIKWFNTPWWSEEIHKAHLIVKYWKLKLWLLKQQDSDTMYLDKIIQQLGPDYDVFQGNPNRKPSSQLWKAQNTGNGVKTTHMH
eukprot:9657272-Ditylum_brightwellii.AAC.1